MTLPVTNYLVSWHCQSQTIWSSDTASHKLSGLMTPSVTKTSGLLSWCRQSQNYAVYSYHTVTVTKLSSRMTVTASKTKLKTKSCLMPMSLSATKLFSHMTSQIYRRIHPAWQWCYQPITMVTCQMYSSQPQNYRVLIWHQSGDAINHKLSWVSPQNETTNTTTRPISTIRAHSCVNETWSPPTAGCVWTRIPSSASSWGFPVSCHLQGFPVLWCSPLSPHDLVCTVLFPFPSSAVGIPLSSLPVGEHYSRCLFSWTPNHGDRDLSQRALVDFLFMGVGGFIFFTPF